MFLRGVSTTIFYENNTILNSLRQIIAILYMGTQSLYASLLTAVCLRCIFGNLWTDIPNTLPASAGITSSGIIAFVVYWLIQLPFAWIHPSKAAPVFAVKSYIAPPTLVITMIWALVRVKMRLQGHSS
jgi:NCS1 family nucleobase:cation symporter-1